MRRSTIGAVALNGRVRDGIGCIAHAVTTKPAKNKSSPEGGAFRGTRDARGRCLSLVHLGQWLLASGLGWGGRLRALALTVCLRACALGRCTSQLALLGSSLPIFHWKIGSWTLSRTAPHLLTTGSYQAYRAISTGQLSTLLRLHPRPIDVVVFHGPQGDLVLRGASRLDAFSGYPVRT